MFTNVQIINQGLGKFASSKIRRIDPPSTNLEIHMADGYLAWKRSELAKHRWVFATEDDVILTVTSTITQTPTIRQPYVYALPTECLRPIRQNDSEWKQRGHKLQSAYASGLTVSMILDKNEDEFDPLFVDVLACRIALESVDFVTQSNVKKEKIQEWYEDAVAVAKGANAFTIGAEDVTNNNDYDYPFLAARFM